MSNVDTSNYVYLALTANFWATSKASEAAAIRSLRDHAGSSWIKRNGWITYRIHPKFEISETWGDVYTPAGHPAIKLTDKRAARHRVA